MNPQPLRRAISDVYPEINRREFDEVEKIECECCGLTEDCTIAYIGHVKESYCGNWVCGLCSEAVKERLKQGPGTAMGEAVSSHKDFCQRFNSTTRVNPSLSLAWSLRDIAKKSSAKQRNSKKTIARSYSCDPRIDLRL